MTPTMRHGALLVSVLSLFGAGCHQSLAVANPLQDVASWAGAVGRSAAAPSISTPTIRNTRDGLAVVGNRGDALNAATRLHQLLLRAQIPNEVVCEMTAGGPAARSELRITFPRSLTAEQRQAVVKTLAGFDGAVPRG